MSKTYASQYWGKDAPDDEPALFILSNRFIPTCLHAY